MMLQESTVESSTVLIGNFARTVMAKSVFADATGPDGQSLYRFGCSRRATHSRRRA